MVNLPEHSAEIPKVYWYPRLLALVLLPVWVFMSGCAVLYENGELFQRAGVIGVGAALSHFLFIRSTFDAQRYYLLSTEMFAVADLFDSRGSTNEVMQIRANMLGRVRSNLQELDTKMARSLTIEVGLIVLPTIQSGLGSSIIHHNGGQ